MVRIVRVELLARQELVVLTVKTVRQARLELAARRELVDKTARTGPLLVRLHRVLVTRQIRVVALLAGLVAGRRLSGE